jgi:hypothetical protein
VVIVHCGVRDQFIEVVQVFTAKLIVPGRIKPYNR